MLLVLLILALAGCGTISGGSPETLPSTPLPAPAARPTAAQTPAVWPTGNTAKVLNPLPTATPMPTITLTARPEALHRRLVQVDQSEQMVYVYENGQEIRRMPCSTGRRGEETYTPAWEGEVGKYVGTFFGFGVYADEGWYLFDHYGGMLIHGAPYLVEDGAKVYQDLDALGVRPTSHGCIRLVPDDAVWFTEWEPRGAHMIISPPPWSE